MITVLITAAQFEEMITIQTNRSWYKLVFAQCTVKSTELLLVLPTWHCTAQNDGYFSDSLLVFINYQIPYCLMIL